MASVCTAAVLDAVLAELEGRGVIPVGPGTAGAVKAVRLVGMQHRQRALGGDALLKQLPGHALQRAPATGRAFVELDFLFAHGLNECPLLIHKAKLPTNREFVWASAYQLKNFDTFSKVL